MKNKKKKFDIKKRKEFIEKTFHGMLSMYPVIVDYSVIYSDEKRNSTNGVFSITYCTKSSDVGLTVYKDAFSKYSNGWLEIALAHEIGHIFTWKLSELVTEPFISKSFYEEVDETTATNIGFVIRKLWQKK